MKFFRIFILISTLLLLAGLELQAQDAREFKLADALSKAGEFEPALEIYLKAYRSGNHSFPVLNGIKNAYGALGRYEELITFLKTVSEQHPEQFNFQIDLGTAYYQNRQTDKALEIWQAVYAQHPPDLMRYRLVANAMTRVRLFDDAIAVYKQAMKDLGDQDLMHLEIGTLYRAQLNYELAVRHYLLYYQNFNKKFNYIRSLILAMTKDDEATDRVIASISAFSEKNGSDPQLEELRAGLYIKKKDFDRAFEMYRRLDRPDGKKTYLLKFAREAERNQAHDYAVKALQMMLEDQNTENILQIRLDLARNYYRKGVLEEAEPPVKQALDILNGIEDLPTERNVYYQSLELTGDIYYTFYEDYDKAIEAYSTILGQRKRGEAANRIRLKLGQTYFMKNDLDKAATLYRNINGGSRKSLALFYHAQLDFFRGRFAKAEKQFQSLLNSLNMSDSLANNVLEYTYLLSSEKGDSLSLALFADGERLEYQHKYARAAEKYTSVVAGKNALGLQSGIRATRLLLHLQEFTECDYLLNTLLQDYEGDPQLDQVYFIRAELYTELEEWERALEQYRQIMITYPNSFYTEEARSRAREIAALQKQEGNP